MDFETYWDTIGSRLQVNSHEERARLAWDAAKKNWDDFVKQRRIENLCGMSYKNGQPEWENEGGACEKEVRK